MKDLEQRVSRAVQHFWTTFDLQAERQGTKSGRKDTGRRSGVTGGRQMDGFNELFCDLLEEGGVQRPTSFARSVSSSLATSAPLRNGTSL
jgi:hypothetical protein